MSIAKYTVTLTGSSPLVMANNQCVDPLNPLTKQIKAITGKRKKTDADHLQVRKLEFQAHLYCRDPIGPYIPSQNIRKMLIEGARKDKNGKQFESGVFIPEDAPLQYDGPRDVLGLLEQAEKFMWSTVCGNQRASIIRTRPKFDSWSCKFFIQAEESLVSEELIANALKHAEIGVGICDARPIGYGRFKSNLEKL